MTPNLGMLPEELLPRVKITITRINSNCNRIGYKDNSNDNQVRFAMYRKNDEPCG